MRTFLKWSLVAGTTFAVDFFTFYVLVNASNQIVLSNISAFLFSTTVNYLLHKYWTFGNQTTHPNNLVRYSIYLSINLILSSFTLTLFCIFTESEAQGKFINSVVWLPINFFVMKMYAFNSKNPNKSKNF
jgi:putative flippase GtrA